MSYWLREVAGWVLLAIGLGLFFLVVQHLIYGRVYQTAGMTLIGIFVFRGGIHLLKVALAVRACNEAAERLNASLADARPRSIRP